MRYLLLFCLACDPATPQPPADLAVAAAPACEKCTFDRNDCGGVPSKCYWPPSEPHGCCQK